MIKVAIGGKSKALLSHLSTDPPELIEDKYDQWEQDDLVIFSWIIQNIEPTIASNLTEFPTVKTLWDALVIIYSSGKDKLQTFDLHVKANEIKQNEMSLEDLWIIMQGIWGEIERRDPNPMTCAVDITTYNKARAEQKLFQFLNAIDHKYDSIKREIMRGDPLPTPEGAYATIRKETAHQNILGRITEEGNGLTAVGSTMKEGSGLTVRSQRRTDRGQPGSFSKIDKSKLKCGHCGMMKHTKEQCFKLVGYPEWWADGNKKGKAATAMGNPEVTSNSSNHTRTNNGGNGGSSDYPRNDEAEPGFGGSAFGFIATTKDSSGNHLQSNIDGNDCPQIDGYEPGIDDSSFDCTAATEEKEGAGKKTTGQRKV